MTFTGFPSEWLLIYCNVLHSDRDSQSYQVMAEFLQIRVTFIDIVAWPTQRYDITFPTVVGDKYADVREMLAYLADTRALRSDDQSM